MLLDKLLAYVVPHECLGCNAEGSLVCDDCLKTVIPMPERCYRCLRVSARSRTCEACRAASPLYAVRARTPYRGIAKDLIWQLKSQGAQAAAQEMARQLTPLLTVGEDIVLIPVPTATTRQRQRGYDQADLLARALARQLRIRYVPALRRLGQHHQVGATRTQRITQLQDAYRCVRPDKITDCHVILIDDVVTTGATLEAAARVMKAAGAKRVSGLVFAQA